jgi:trehalose-phosphatase
MTRDIVAAINWAWRDSHLLLCCALDGVLTERGEHPGHVRMPASRRALLASLASLDSASVCISSGRRLAQVQALIGRDRRIHYVGLRGLEIEGPRLSFFHLGAARIADVMTPLAAALHDLARQTPGLVVEYRNLYLAVRLGWLADAARREDVTDRVREFVAPFARTHRLRLVSCGSDLEVLPDVKWTTADAVREIRLSTERQHGRCTTVVMGNAEGEDDVFDAVRDSGLAIHVGRVTGPAAFRAVDSDEVEEVLLGLVKIGHRKLGPDARVAL